MKVKKTQTNLSAVGNLYELNLPIYICEFISLNTCSEQFAIVEYSWSYDVASLPNAVAHLNSFFFVVTID